MILLLANDVLFLFFFPPLAGSKTSRGRARAKGNPSIIAMTTTMTATRVEFHPRYPWERTLALAPPSLTRLYHLPLLFLLHPWVEVVLRGGVDGLPWILSILVLSQFLSSKINLYILMRLRISIRGCFCPSIRPSIRPSVHPYVRPSVHSFVRSFVRLSRVVLE